MGKETFASERSEGILRFVMHIIGEAVLLLVLLFFVQTDAKVEWAWFYDFAGLLSLYGTVLVMLLITGLLSDFFNSFAYSLKKQSNVTTIKIKRSLLALQTTMLTAVAAQAVIVIFYYVSLMSDPYNDLSGNISAVTFAILGGGAIYGALTVVILLPVWARLKARLISMRNPE